MASLLKRRTDTGAETEQSKQELIDVKRKLQSAQGARMNLRLELNALTDKYNALKQECKDKEE